MQSKKHLIKRKGIAKMKIKKHGKKFSKQKPTIESFVCGNCKCEFECKEDEFHIDHSTNISQQTSLTFAFSSEETLVCSCPECHKIVKKTRACPPVCSPTITTDDNVNINTHVTTKMPVDPYIEITPTGVVNDNYTRTAKDNYTRTAKSYTYAHETFADVIRG